MTLIQINTPIPTISIINSGNIDTPQTLIVTIDIIKEINNG